MMPLFTLAAVTALTISGFSAKPHGWMARDANPNHAWLYVSDGAGNTVDIFDLQKFGIPQIGQIAQGLNTPAGATVDSSGTFYVANQNGLNPGGNVMIFPPGATSPSLTLTQGLSIPVDVAVASTGNVYVSNRGSVTQHRGVPSRPELPSQTIKSSLIQVPTELVFDANRNLYDVDYNTGVLEIPYGSQQPVALGLQQMHNPSAIAIDPLNGDLIVGGNQGGSDPIRVYRPGSTQPLRTLNGDAARHACYIAIGDVKGAEYIFVPDGATNGLSILPA